MTLQDLIDKQFGVKTKHRINNVTTSVGTTSTIIAGNNPNRLALTIINMSPNTIYIAPDEEVSSSRGIVVSPNGGSVQFLYNEDFQMTGYEFYATASAVSTIFVLEVEIAK